MERRALGLMLSGLLVACGGGDFPSGTGGGSGGGGFATGGGGGTTSQSCGPQNCTGCCFNGACQPGSTAAGCGKAGASCTACASAQICRVDQTCGVDPESTWVVQPTAAQIASSNNGSTWDGDNSGPDVQVTMTCADVAPSTVTPEVSDSYRPTWSTGGCAAKAKDLLRAGWTFQVFDIDVLADDTITSPLLLRLTEQDFVTGSLSVGPNGGLQSMSVSLRKQ